MFERLNVLTVHDLEKNILHELPIADQTRFGTLSFLAQHESYQIGQLGFLRKFLGFEAVKYS